MPVSQATVAVQASPNQVQNATKRKPRRVGPAFAGTGLAGIAGFAAGAAGFSGAFAGSDMFVLNLGSVE
jgi:hypothetical protein